MFDSLKPAQLKGSRLPAEIDAYGRERVDLWTEYDKEIYRIVSENREKARHPGKQKERRVKPQAPRNSRRSAPEQIFQRQTKHQMDMQKYKNGKDISQIPPENFQILFQTQNSDTILFAGHPCCHYWGNRQLSLDWTNQWMPELYPNDQAITGWSANWISPSRLDMSFGVSGNYDNVPVGPYTGTLYRTASTGPLSYPGFVQRVFMSVNFQWSYLYATGSDDWFTADDKGWAVAFYQFQLLRSRGSQLDVIYNTFSHTPEFGSSLWLEHQAMRDVRSLVSPSTLGDVSHSVFFDNDGERILVAPGDSFMAIVGLKFWVKAYGDEGARGAMSATNGGYIEFPKVQMLIEECRD